MQPEVKARLLVYRDLLLKWQRSVNLVSPSTLPDVWERHFEDSLQLLDMLPPDATSIADIGSGAGFPGLVLAMARPDLTAVHLIESDAKKCAFLKSVSRETDAVNVVVHNDRIESVLPTLKVDVVTARALAPLPDLLHYAACQMGVDKLEDKPAICLFMKGENWRSEVDAALEMEGAEHKFEISHKPSKTAAKAAILCIRCAG